MRCFFFNDTATTEIYTLSLHDALPIYIRNRFASSTTEKCVQCGMRNKAVGGFRQQTLCEDRKSTRLNSSHANISYAVFCLKKKKITTVSPSNTRSQIRKSAFPSTAPSR